MIRYRDFKKYPLFNIGVIMAVACFLLILLLFLYQFAFGDLGNFSNYILFYVIPLLLVLSIILLTINKFRVSGERKKRRKRKKRTPPSAGTDENTAVPE